ncbi:hypothetical protein I204_07095 [Kwoniella mangroviensis CBS 8886]|uniref:uncharacterized protein n=1 Tax=Kwoniella mangroviensis CBS 8507 TaxID=1296122 RepID=UPI00080D353E|nr:uncharacterized protein I203_00931 [Kwoniella mangroviensis CBS 8507]OCF69080.1 hypothetical protein I203_00931 [Kwoniella mangroviensis CBS 8507]OCF72710.1 hypothetical protein I204_07095 [Kwoniella mangroviensis CBS 8886]
MAQQDMVALLLRIIKISKAYRKALFPKPHQRQPETDIGPTLEEICLKLVKQNQEWEQHCLEMGWIRRARDQNWAMSGSWKENIQFQFRLIVDLFKLRLDENWYGYKYGINPSWTTFKDIPDSESRRSFRRLYPYHFLLLDLCKRNDASPPSLNGPDPEDVSDGDVEMTEDDDAQDDQSSDGENDKDDHDSSSSDKSHGTTLHQPFKLKSGKTVYKDPLIHTKNLIKRNSQELLATFIGEKNISRRYRECLVDRHVQKRLNLNPQQFLSRFKLECGIAGCIKSTKQSRKGQPLRGVDILVPANYEQDSVAADIVTILRSAGVIICTDPSAFVVNQQREQYSLTQVRCEAYSGHANNPLSLPPITLEVCLRKILDGYHINTSPRVELEEALQQAVIDAQTRSTVGTGIGVRIAPEVPRAVRNQLEYIIRRENFTQYNKQKRLLEHPKAQGRILVSIKAKHRGPHVPTSMFTKTCTMTPLLFAKFVNQRR